MQKKLLFIHQGAIGDIVSLFPAIIKLKEKFNRIDAICNKNIGDLACLLKLTNRTYPVEAAFFSSIFSDKIDPIAADILRAYDEILFFSYSDEIEKTISGTTQKAICRIPPRPDASQKIHILEYILKRLARHKLTDNYSLPEKGYYDYLEKEIWSIKTQHNGSKIMIHPGSGSRKKNWPASNFIKLYKNLESKGISSEIIIGPAEYEIAENFKTCLPSNSIVHSPSNLPELVQILKGCSGFIGNDSGVSHLAAFIGIPAIVIFGPSDPKRWKPFGRFVKVLRSQTDCRPCFETGKPDCQDIKCLSGISPELVTDTLYFSLLKNNLAP